MRGPWGRGGQRCSDWGCGAPGRVHAEVFGEAGVRRRCLGHKRLVRWRRAIPARAGCLGEPSGKGWGGRAQLGHGHHAAPRGHRRRHRRLLHLLPGLGGGSGSEAVRDKQGADAAPKARPLPPRGPPPKVWPPVSVREGASGGAPGQRGQVLKGRCRVTWGELRRRPGRRGRAAEGGRRGHRAWRPRWSTQQRQDPVWQGGRRRWGTVATRRWGAGRAKGRGRAQAPGRRGRRRGREWGQILQGRRQQLLGRRGRGAYGGGGRGDGEELREVGHRVADERHVPIDVLREGLIRGFAPSGHRDPGRGDLRCAHVIRKVLVGRRRACHDLG